LTNPAVGREENFEISAAKRANRIIIDTVGQSETLSPEEYLPRLGAFLIIIVAIIEKNRKKS
jgi:hypothetical protein